MAHLGAENFSKILIHFIFSCVIAGLNCFCEGHCSESAQNNTCEVKGGGQCFAMVEEVYDDISGQIEAEYSFGCISADQASSLLQVSITLKMFDTFV
jgi:Activin types I and II receptor domain